MPKRTALKEGRHMNVLVVDIGGTHVKVLATGQTEHREYRWAAGFAE